MRLWIAEGFVQKTEVKSLEDTAEDYIMDLIVRSLVMVDKPKSTGGVKTCRIHDLLHEFCLRKATEENLLKLRRDDAGLPKFDEPSSMNYIPSSIANLWNLETFILKSLHGRLFLPDTVWNMQTLRCLHVSGKFFDLSLAKDNLDSSSDLCNLDTISALELDLGQSMDKIMKKFPHIRKLKCSLHETEEACGDWSKIVAMDFLRRLESLKLSFYRVKDKDYGFSFPMNLKKLTLEAFPWSMISSIGSLPNLEVLKLLGTKAGGEEIWNMEEGEFPKPKFLKLELLCIVRWTCSGDHLPCLQKLVLESCLNLEELPS
ncbi:putative late blight resistance protein homolog R1A-3 [Coffea eugenioides]|uniref:putative late blight resistance protein homolog R1A-3 n=1 Tax=Coffea eugenioides TaxID=49369 RepID=UPI000F6129BC|nr:putative late blight resistance protein homolog R1A-3 [Coffea eugenioides]